MDVKLTVDLNNLSETERQVISNVLKRDDDLRKRDEQRILRLKSELQWLRRRGAIRGGLDPMTSCARCRCQLGKILNRGSPCSVCRAKVCKSCRVYARDGVQWFCVVCHKQLEIEAATGEWMNEFVRRTSRHRDRKAGFIAPADIVRATISRSHSTQNNPATGDNHGRGGQRRATVVASSMNPRGTPSLMDRRQGKASALSVSPDLSLPPSPEISRSPRSPRDRSLPSSTPASASPPLPSPRQKSPLLKQKAIISDNDLHIVDQTEVTATASAVAAAFNHRGLECNNSSAIPSAAPRRRAPPGAPHHPSDRSDSGIGPDSVTPLTPRSPKAYSVHSESVHSRQSSSCSSGQGIGGGEASWRTTTESGGATDSVSELSDSEVEPSTGVVFRKVSLKRRKHKDGRHASYGQCSSLVVDESSTSHCPQKRSREPEAASFNTPPNQFPLNPSRFPGDLSAAALEANLICTNSDDCFWWAGGKDAAEDVRSSFLRSFLDSSSLIDCRTKNLSRSLEFISSAKDSDNKDCATSSGLSSSWTSGDASLLFDSRRWNNIWFGSPEFEEDFLADCCGTAANILPNSDSCSDILCNVHDRIVPEGSEYRIVFISSSSSKSSGLNSGGEDGGSPSVLLMDDCDWEVASAATTDVDSPPPPPLPLAPPPVLPPGALGSFSPTFSLEEGEEEYAMTNETCPPSPAFGPFTLLAAQLSEMEEYIHAESNEIQVDVEEEELGLRTLFSDLDSLSSNDGCGNAEILKTLALASKQQDFVEGLNLNAGADASIFIGSNDLDFVEDPISDPHLVEDVGVSLKSAADSSEIVVACAEDVPEDEIGLLTPEPSIDSQENGDVIVKSEPECSAVNDLMHEEDDEPVTSEKSSSDNEPGDEAVTSEKTSSNDNEEEECVETLVPEESSEENTNPKLDDVDAELKLHLDSGRVEVEEASQGPSVAQRKLDDNQVQQLGVAVTDELDVEVDESTSQKVEVKSEVIRIVKPAVVVADLHQLIAQSRALRDNGQSFEQRQSLEESSRTSVLEKYFVTTLEQTGPSHHHHHHHLKLGRVNRPHLLKSSPPDAVVVVPVIRVIDVDDHDDEIDGQQADDDESTTGEEEDEDDSDNCEEDDSDNTTAFDSEDDSDDDEEDDSDDSTVSSTSSDEGTIYLKMPTSGSGHDSNSGSNFRNDLDMSLHTIVEESCEESESERSVEERNSRRRDEAARLSDPSELERYYRYTFIQAGGATGGGGVQQPAILLSPIPPLEDVSTSESPPDVALMMATTQSLNDDASDDTMSETGSSCFSESFTDVDVDDDDDELARLASSRLEKYFLTGFLGMDTTAFSLSLRATSPPIDHSLDDVIVLPADVKEGGGGGGEEIPFAKNDGCDTIKRKKKKNENKKQADRADVEDVDIEDDDVLRAISKILNDEHKEEEAIEEETKEDSMISNEDDVAKQQVDFVCGSLTEADILTTPLDARLEDKRVPALGLIEEVSAPDEENVLLDTQIVEAVDIYREPEGVAEKAEDKLKLKLPEEVTNQAGVDSPYLGVGRSLNLDWKQQSRDSGFIGSSDDLLIRERELEDEDADGDDHIDLDDDDVDDDDQVSAKEMEQNERDMIKALVAVEEQKQQQRSSSSINQQQQPLSTVSSSSSIFGQFRGSARSTRSNRSARSINFCTSDDEAQYIVNQLVTQIAKSMARSPQLSRAKPPEIEVFEEELTKLMQSVPGIDATVKELVEELSSTDYCSDSTYESSDYASSDQEMTNQLQPNNPFTFEVHKAQPFPVGGGLLRRNDSGRSWRSSTSTASRASSSLDGIGGGGHLSSEETMFIYQRFMDSLTKMAEHASDDAGSIGGDSSKSSKSGNRSPPTFTKIVSHIRDKVTSLMREVQGSSPNDHQKTHGRKKIVWRKPGSGCGSAAGDELSSISSTTSSMTFDSEDSPTDTELSIDSDDPAAAANLTGPFHALNQTKTIVDEMSALSGSKQQLHQSSGFTTPDNDDDEATRSTSDGLERWNSDMTIVDDGDVRFTSVHKSEPMLSIPDDRASAQAEDKRHSLSFDNRLAARIGKNKGFPSNSLQQRHHSAENHQQASSSGSLYWTTTSKDKESAKRKCKSEWEMWRCAARDDFSVDDDDDDDDVNCSSQTISSNVPVNKASPQTYKSCDYLLPSSVRSKQEARTTTTITTTPTNAQGGLYQQHGSSKDRRKHGLTFMWRQKSGSSTSLREGPVTQSESPTIKQQIQYRSSHQLQQSVSKKKEDHHQQQQVQQQKYLWPFGSNSSSKNKDSSKWSSSVKSCLSSPESLSTVGVSVVDQTSSCTLMDTWDDGESDGVRLLSHRSLDCTTASNPIVHKAHPLGHRTMPWSLSSSSSSKSKSSKNLLPTTSTSTSISNQQLSSSSSSSSFWSKASTLPRAAGPSDLSFVPNVSFLHKSNRSLLTTTAATAAANNKYSRLLSPPPPPQPHPHPVPSYSRTWCLSSPPRPNPTTSHPASTTSIQIPVPEQDLRRPNNKPQFQQQQQHPVAAARQPPASSPRSTTVASGIVTKNLESPKFRREVRSWPDENSPPVGPAQVVSTDPQSGGHRLKPVVVTPVETAKFIPNISVVEYSEKGVPRGTASHAGSSDHESMAEEDIDRLVALHKNRSLSSLGVCSESMSSVYSAAGGGHYGNVTVRGEVEFGLGYNYVSGALEVTVKQCRDLAPVDVKRSRSDPYVKVYLLPDKSKSGKRKTRVKKHTLNPTFNEVLKFNVTISELETRTLWLTVWHSDMFGRNEFLGEVTLPMGYEAFDDSSSKWYLLQERLGPPEEVFSYKGDLVVALRFVPPDVTTQKRGQRRKGSLHVLVKEARNLMAVSANGTSDPFCKCYLLPDKGKNNKQKTPVVKRSCHPKWNHTFVYEDVSLESLWERCLELTVWDYDRLTSNDFLGGVRLSLGSGKYQGKKVDWMDSRGEEVSVWQTVLERPNVWVDSIVLLRPTMDHRQTSSL